MWEHSTGMEAVTDLAPRTAPRGLRHIAGFEGLRGIGLVFMLLYHGGYTGIEGAILTVSMFFTLSGYLITALIRDEHIRTLGINLRNFWTARARRLLPAGLLTLLLIVVFHRAFGAIDPEQLRGDVLSALFYGENWWLIHTNQSYGAVFGQSSPVQNFWSLAIEEQFYLVLPLIWVGLRLTVNRTRMMGVVFALGALASFILAAAVSESWGVTRTYFGTDTRAGELLVGVALAHFVTGHRIDLSERGRMILTRLSYVAVITMAWLWWQAGLHDWFTFHGGTALNALCTSVIILACLQPGFVASITSIPVLRWLGRLSYGIYLLHWPVFLWLDSSRIPLAKEPLFVVRMAVTLFLATLMYRFVELPIRKRTLLRPGRFGIAMVSLTVAIVIGSLLLTGSDGTAVNLANAPAANQQLATLPATPAAATKTRVLVVGDSLSWSLSVGLEEWGTRHDLEVEPYFGVACGIGGPGMLRYLGIERPPPADCGTWHESLRVAVARFRPDIVVVVMGLADLSPRRFPGGKFLSIGDPEFDRFLRPRITTVTRDLASAGARVVWATVPYSQFPYVVGTTGSPPFPENERERLDRLNAMIRDQVRAVPGTAVVDFAGYSHDRPGGELDPVYRPDGVHLVTASTSEVADWLGPQLVAMK